MSENPNNLERTEHVTELHVPPKQKPERIDAYITKCVMHATRSRVQKAIDNGTVTVNGKPTKSNYKIKPNDYIKIVVMRLPPVQLIPQDIPLDVLFEDDDVLVINKPAGLAVHPGIGNRSGTLVNAVLWHIGLREALDVQGAEEEWEALDEDVIAEKYKLEEQRALEQLEQERQAELLKAQELAKESDDEDVEEDEDYDDEDDNEDHSRGMLVEYDEDEIENYVDDDEHFDHELVIDSEDTPHEIEEEVDEGSDDDEVLEIRANYKPDETRPGIIHRLDKNTSGVMVIGKSYETTLSLSNQFRDRTVTRSYVALVWGVVKEDTMLIEGDIGRSPRDRRLQAIVEKGGKYAATEVTVLERYDCATLIACKLRTGRTHQIRVHMASKHHSIIADNDYNGGEAALVRIHHLYRKKAQQVLGVIRRQALHARVLGFIHPVTKQQHYFETEMPADMQQALDILRS